MEGLKKYGRYYELNIDDIFNLKIDLNVTNRNEYLLMNLFSTGGTINPLSSSLVYSNRSTQSNVDFGNKIKLKDYKRIVSATSNYITVINADDYYGKEGFRIINEFLSKPSKSDKKYHFCMAGFLLGNTLSENGTVTRGVCSVNEDGVLENVTETHEIRPAGDKAIATEDGKDFELSLDCPVSMNMWGFTPDFLDELQSRFVSFLENVKEGDLKAEYLLPQIVDDLIKEGKAEVTVLNTNDKWFGVTYKEDKQTVVDSFRKLVDEGEYPERLFD